MDHISVPLTQLVASLELLRRGVIDHERCDPGDFDRAVVTLAASHDQLGGETRRLLYALFAASSNDAAHDELTLAIHNLRRRLEPPHPDKGTEQLELFTEDRPR
jgi:hypothetical protein